MLYGLLIWFIVTLYVTYAFCLNTAAGVFSGAVKASLDLSDEVTSLAMGAYIVGYACAQIPAGYLLDKYNPRIIVPLGVLILSLGSILGSYANHVGIFSLANLIQGIGGSFAFIAAGVLIAQWFSARAFPIMFGLTQTVSCTLSAVFHYEMMKALENTSWNSIYQKLGGLGMVLLLLSVIVIKRGAIALPASGLTLRVSLRETLQNNQIVLCAIAAAMSFGVVLAYASYWYMDVQNYYAVDPSNALIIGGMIFTGIGIGMPILGWISERVESRMKVIHSTLVLGTMALIAGIYLPHFPTHSYLFIKLLSFTIGFLLSGSLLLYTVVTERASPQTRGVALSVTNTGVFLMNTLMIFFPYVLKMQKTDLFFTYLWIFPFMILFSILVVYFIKETYNGRT